MQRENSAGGYFLDKIESFNFEKIYTKKIRLLLHFFMWFFFGSLLMLAYKFSYQLTFFEGLVMTIRMTVVNMSIFYFFFYVVVPSFKYLNRIKSILLLLLSIILCGILWLLITYLFSVSYHYFGIEISAGELKGAIGMSAAQTLLEAISPLRLMSQAIIIFSNLAPFFFFKILFEIFRVYNKVLTIQKQKATLEIEKINIEKDFLKAQLNPHFLFNTLNNLYGLVLKKDDYAQEVILNLSEIMSYTLYESNAVTVPLEKELEFIQNYFQLEKMRHAANKNISFKLINHTSKKLTIAPLLTFTFIENAFKYGLKNNDNSFLNMIITIEDNQFKFMLLNDVEKKSQVNNLGGIGLDNVKKRLLLLYPSNHELFIKEGEKKFEVDLVLNLQEEWKK